MRINSKLTVYSERLNHNLTGIQSLCPGKKIIPMIKANAYGHGLFEVGEFLNSYSDQIDYLGVASLGEALHLRKIRRLIGKTILVFSENDITDVENYINFNIVPVVSQIEELEIFLDKFPKNFPLCIKFNTGMNRIGIDADEAGKAIELIKKNGRSEIQHVMSHYGSSYLVDHQQPISQRESFQKILAELKAFQISVAEVSLDNSGAIEQGHTLQESTHVRPGLMMYGPQSTMAKKQIWNGKIISDFEARITSVRQVKKGDPVGYGAAKAPQNGTILYIPVGYGDGITLGYSGFSFPFEGKILQYFGRVNMDLTAFFVEDDQAKKYKGKLIQIWNENPEHFNKLVNHLGTHAYQVFCSITSRVPRQFVLK